MRSWPQEGNAAREESREIGTEAAAGTAAVTAAVVAATIAAAAAAGREPEVVGDLGRLPVLAALHLLLTPAAALTCMT